MAEQIGGNMRVACKRGGECDSSSAPFLRSLGGAVAEAAIATVRSLAEDAGYGKEKSRSGAKCALIRLLRAVSFIRYHPRK